MDLFLLIAVTKVGYFFDFSIKTAETVILSEKNRV